MAYLCEETLKAFKNFDIGYKRTELPLIYAIVTVKKSAALTYAGLGIDKMLFEAVTAACDEILSGTHDDEFITDALQGGAGTSANMNVNEVIAGIAGRYLAGKTDIPVRPIDDVNRGQSTNDVYPTALRIACIKMIRDLSNECALLQEALQKKEQEFASVHKLGRTELMDALPITLGEEFGAYSQAIARDRWRIYKAEERMRQVNIGGTAVGNYVNADKKYRFRMIENLRKLTGIGLCEAEYPMDLTQNNDVFVETSGLLKALSVNLMKIAGDLRLMASGPKGGLGEIRLEKMQKGSSIMPGKVNPVIPEMVMQCAMKVQADDYAITLAASHGEFELNAFEPVIADSMLESLKLLISATRIFREKCIETLLPQTERCERILRDSYAFATEYVPKLGYDYVAALVEKELTPGELEKCLKDALENIQAKD